jgi:hypothetical protein
MPISVSYPAHLKAAKHYLIRSHVQPQERTTCAGLAMKRKTTMNTKYDTDGNLETIDRERLQVGNVLRMTKDGSKLSSFSDSVITGIRVNRPLSCGYTDFDNLIDALEDCNMNEWVEVTLTRPYVFAHLWSYLLGVETYSVESKRLLETHKVVVMSTGEYDRRVT